MEQDRRGRDNISGKKDANIQPVLRRFAKDHSDEPDAVSRALEMHAKLHPHNPDPVKLRLEMHAKLHPGEEQKEHPVEKPSEAEKLLKARERSVRNGIGIILGNLQRIRREIVHFIKPRLPK